MNRTDAAAEATIAIHENLFSYNTNSGLTTRKMKRCVAAVNSRLPIPLRPYVIDHLYAEFDEAERWGGYEEAATYVRVLNDHLSGAGYEGEPFTVEQFATLVA